jgi:hypothetical protein
MTSSSVEPDARARAAFAPISSLRSLIGAHPDALARLFASARPADPADLGEAPRGYLLAPARGGDVFLALRPFLRVLAAGVLPWRGKTFDHGGNSGQNVVLGKRVLRFQAEVGPSRLDARPALVLSYDLPAHGNPWPVRALRDELRSVGPGVAIGPVLAGTGSAPLVWFGLTRS